MVHKKKKAFIIKNFLRALSKKEIEETSKKQHCVFTTSVCSSSCPDPKVGVHSGGADANPDPVPERAGEFGKAEQGASETTHVEGERSHWGQAQRHQKVTH